MPRKYELTWHKKTKRWRKRYKGKEYNFRCGKSKSDIAGYRKALAEWHKVKAEIDREEEHRTDPDSGIPPSELTDDELRVRDIRRSIREHQRLADWCEGQGDTEGHKAFDGAIESLREKLRSGEELLPTERDPLRFASEGGRAIWADRLNQARQIHREDTIESNIEEYLEAKDGQVVPARWDKIRTSLLHFQKWMGGKKRVMEIDESVLRNYRSHIKAKVDGEQMSALYGRDFIVELKQFVRYCWRYRKMELPRNIDGRELTISVPIQSIQVFELEEIKALLKEATDRTALYILLALNCGMLQSGISATEAKDVDLRRGTITRKRTKTKSQANVPVVTYRLWPRTKELLKEFRSEDPDHFLLNKNGGPIREDKIVDDKLKRNDAVKNAFDRLRQSTGIKKPFSLLRKTSASLLEKHKEFARYAQYFLGHSPKTVADRHYVQPSQDRFDRAVKWLGEQYGQA